MVAENPPGVTFEWLILSDAAEVVGNKLYLLGGGWDRLTVHSTFPVVQHCALATSLLVDWEETQKNHQFLLEIVDQHDNLITAVEAEFEVGRPPGVEPGRPQRWQFATDLELVLEAPGRHAAVASVGEEELGRQEFEVVSGIRAADLPD